MDEKEILAILEEINRYGIEGITPSKCKGLLAKVDRAIEVMPNDQLLLTSKAILLSKLGRVDEAMEILDPDIREESRETKERVFDKNEEDVVKKVKYHIPMKVFIALKIIIFLFVLNICYESASVSQHHARTYTKGSIVKSPVKAKKQKRSEEFVDYTDGYQGEETFDEYYDLPSLRINQPIDLNGYSKEEIYSMRERLVSRSVFNSPDYKPSESIFGGIDSNRPWWGWSQRICSSEEPGFNRTEGASSVSRYINNPDMLIGTVFPYNRYREYVQTDYCTSQTAKAFPVELKYDESKKMIVAIYEMEPRILKEKIRWADVEQRNFLNLAGLNARDFGFNYAYASNLKNIEMLEETNISNQIYSFRDFIHVGSSCKVPGGCNNLSPYQPQTNYRPTALPAEMTIKLWKEKPKNPKSKADFYYKMVFKTLR